MPRCLGIDDDRLQPPEFEVFVDDNLVGEHRSIGGTEGLQPISSGNQLNTYSQVRIVHLVPLSLHPTVIAEAKMGLMGNGVHQARRLGALN